MSDERIEAAEAFLQESVFRSRAKQASIAGLAGQTPDAELEIGQCGLGKKAAVELDLSGLGLELADRLWSGPLPEDELARVHEVMREWVRAQDGFDRDRNHFLKAFRREHGVDRHTYSPELLSEYDAGLTKINDAANRTRREHAERLLAAGS